jgi:hypothetical protein
VIGSLGIGVVNVGDIVVILIKKNHEVIFDPPPAQVLPGGAGVKMRFQMRSKKIINFN